MQCNCELCRARKLGIHPAELALQNDSLALEFRKKQIVIAQDGNEYLYVYRKLAKRSRESGPKYPMVNGECTCPLCQRTKLDKNNEKRTI